MSGINFITTPLTSTPKVEAPGAKKGIGFKRMMTVERIFTDEEMDTLIAHAQDKGMGTGTISGGAADDRIRRSDVTWLRRAEGFDWLYERIWPEIQKLNKDVFQFDITGFAGSIQLARYDAGNEGFYNWHMDNGEKNTTRKISFSVQVSDPADYDGGDLELWYKIKTELAPKARGSITAFPSFVMHKVRPVTRGTRFSLVAWIDGPRWR